MYHIQETDKPNGLFKLCNIVRLEQDKIILPIKEDCITQRQAEKLAKKTKNILCKTNCNKIVVSKQIQQYEAYMNELYCYDFDIVDGTWLFEALLIKVLDYILDKKEKQKKDVAISILINEIDEMMLAHIQTIVQTFKRVNIVTNHIGKFRRIEKQVLDDYGIMITVTNNKRKSLLKSDVIVNVDFPSELVNEYIINDNAIIINLKEQVKIYKKRFQGINICDYEILYENREVFDYDKAHKYKARDIYESLLYKNQPVSHILKRIEKDNIRIQSLKGLNSKV